MQLTQNFTLNEFKSKDGKEFPLDVINNLRFLSVQLQTLRNALGKSISITSGYRSPEHNKKIGGALNSFHVKGMAADIQVPGMTPKEVYDKIEELIKSGSIVQGGLGLYKSWVHYDTRGVKARWNG